MSYRQGAREVRGTFREANGALREGGALIGGLLGFHHRVNAERGREELLDAKIQNQLNREYMRSGQGQGFGGNGQYQFSNGNGSNNGAHFLSANPNQPHFGGNGGNAGQQYGNGQASGGQSQQQGMSPEEATERFVFAMQDAALAKPDSPERAAFLAKARAILDDPKAGLKAADGSIHLPEMLVKTMNGTAVRFNIDKGGDYLNYANSDAAMAQLAKAMDTNDIGYIITPADLAKLSAGTTIPQGQPAPQPPAAGAQPPQTQQGQTQPPQTQQGGAPAPSGDATPKPAAEKQGNAKLYGGVTAEQAPAINQDRVQEIQRLLGKDALPKFGADGLWGKETQAAFEKAAKAAGIADPSKIDFTNPENPLTKQFDTYVRGQAGKSAPAPEVKPTGRLDSLGEELKVSAASEEATGKPAAAVAAVAGGSPEVVAALAASTADASNVAPLAAPPSIQPYTPVAGVSATAMGTPPTAEAKPVVAAVIVADSAAKSNFLAEVAGTLSFGSAVTTDQQRVSELETRFKGQTGVVADGNLSREELALAANAVDKLQNVPTLAAATAALVAQEGGSKVGDHYEFTSAPTFTAKQPADASAGRST